MFILARKILWPFLLFFCQAAYTQTYKVNGSATQNSCNCYTLTTDVMNQSGSVWNETKIDLQQPFDFKFNVYLGCTDVNGADGMAFILQTVPTSVGRSGSGLGFAGVSPSIGIALDTYQNTVIGNVNDDLNDPAYDHISIQTNGKVQHGNDLAEPIPASAITDNIEDCKWHVLRITWDPATQKLETFFDGAFRVGATVDLIDDIFGNASPVYWGFSASTGGAVNVQKFCTALNPDFNSTFPGNGTCIGTPVTVNDQSLSFAPVTAYFWDFGDGTTSNSQTPPPHLYQAPGIYPVRLAITALDGCKSDTLQKLITIGSIPKADFSVSDACFKTAPEVRFTNTNIGTTYKWLIDGAEFSTAEHPQLPQRNAGSYNLERNVISDYNCGTDAVSKTFIIKPLPVVEPVVPPDVCVGVSNAFTGVQKDNNTLINTWGWTFGDGQRSADQNTVHAYGRPAGYIAKLWALATNGCSSDTVAAPITAQQARANAGPDTIVLNNVPFTLNGTGNGTPKWSPPVGLSRDDVLAPVSALTKDQQYELTITTAGGCLARDTVKIEVFKGSAVYVPNAFTPNGNTLNDKLIPIYVGIKKLRYFTIYNRWGQLVFTTANLSAGWDGRFGNKEYGTGSFVWMLRAEDIAGKVYQMKGTFTLIR